MELIKSKIEKPLLIAGPCSAETREQVFDIAKSLSGLEVSYFRAGIWKPRTRPGDFEGMGGEGLSWLKEIKKVFNLPVCTEVANVKHVYEALKTGLDMVWIGSRTTTNPFSVQEIAEALRGVDITVMVKNPINPDLKLWIGAIERLHNSGIKNLAAIHRGFSVYEKIEYRYQPQWQIAIDLQNEIPELPVICDPSHISGNSKYVSEISQKAMDLNFDGLMIETHNSPKNAWTDANQQVTPEMLKTILSDLVIRDQSPTGISGDELIELREQINHLDQQLLTVLSNRMDVARKIGMYKKENGITILQNNRWKTLLSKNISLATSMDLSEHFASKLFKLIHQESINIQEFIFNKSKNARA